MIPFQFGITAVAIHRRYKHGVCSGQRVVDLGVDLNPTAMRDAERRPQEDRAFGLVLNPCPGPCSFEWDIVLWIQLADELEVGRIRRFVAISSTKFVESDVQTVANVMCKIMLIEVSQQMHPMLILNR